MELSVKEKFEFSEIFKQILKLSPFEIRRIKFSREVNISFNINDEIRVNVRNPDIFKYKCFIEITREQVDLMSDVLILIILRYCKSITIDDIKVKLNDYLIGLV